jgi:hypothetical protein
MSLILRNSAIFGIVILSFASCRTAQWHLDKAIDKGAIIEPEIRYEKVVEHDTIVNEVTGETIIIERIDSIPYEVQKIKYIPLSRQERLKYRDSLKWAYRQMKELSDAYTTELRIKERENRQNQKTERTKSRQENKRSLWYVWFGLGAIFMIILRLVILPYLQGFLGKR